MNVSSYILALAIYGENAGLTSAEDRNYIINQILEALELDSFDECAEPVQAELHQILDTLTDDAVAWGIIEDNNVARDLFDTKLMGILTPYPREVRQKFRALYTQSPEAATDWFYRFSQDTNYIRRDRIVKDRKWKFTCEYGDLDITINLSKPEKDPRAIAAMGRAPQFGYPKCALCANNEGYAGRMNHPARQNHRVIPLTVSGGEWYLQYSPYVYYNEHCIALNGEHTPMQINRAAFDKLLDFVGQFPHYFMGSNADLPIVGGSILSHDHFQGGRYTFAMASAPVERELTFQGYEDVDAGIVRWPMSVIRLTAADPSRLSRLADKLLTVWRNYTDEDAFIFAETDGTPHNTITPIARMVGGKYQLDLVLRNNITTAEHPLGVYHPHSNLHHIKKENIGLIEVMGLAVLPARLDKELTLLKNTILSGRDIRADQSIAKHADWADELRTRHVFTPENADEILQQEVGAVFLRVLLDAGVYKRTAEGQSAFLRFIETVNTQ